MIGLDLFISHTFYLSLELRSPNPTCGQGFSANDHGWDSVIRYSAAVSSPMIISKKGPMVIQ